MCDGGKGPKLPDALTSHLESEPHERGTKYIDLVVLTHVDHDHQGGIPALFLDPDVEVGEYWGPCLPAFQRLKWLFHPRVFKAIERAKDLEFQIEQRNVSILYPMESHSKTMCERRVTISVLSPPPRLIRQLLAGSSSSLQSLFTTTPLPLDWLITGVSLEEDQDQQQAIFSLLDGRTYLAPEDFSRKPSEMTVDSLPDLLNQATERCGTAIEPEFFGNNVLNDTSLVLAVDILLDGKRRRRILLTGDQENWSYIASRHPAGLGVDVVKVPHHGGRVYLADKEEEQAIEQMYLWLRPRMAVISAMGQHSLPHVRVREALRVTGTSLLCPNTRSFEPLSPGTFESEDACCFQAYGCNRKTGKQTAALTLRLSASKESADMPACIQGTIHRGPAPILVQTQRLIEPDETFVRWTRTDIEKQAKWLKRTIETRHQEFLKAITSSKDPLGLVLKHQGVPWRELDMKARSAGHFHLVADPRPVLKFALARRLIQEFKPERAWSEGHYYYILPSVNEIDDLIRWVDRIPNLLVIVNRVETNWLATDNRFALFSAASLDFLKSILAVKLRMPVHFLDYEVMPRVITQLTQAFSCRICNANSIYSQPEDGCTVILHLHKGSMPTPDIFSMEWHDSVWDSSPTTESAIAFLLHHASKDIFLPSLHTSSFNPNAFGDFMPIKESSWIKQRDYSEGHFQDAFEGAAWTELWTA
jgi:hypothetical protein